jgi:acetolactate synthase I/II/III large subunit
MLKLSDYVARRIAGMGVRHVFLLAGGGCMHLVDSVGRCESIEYVCNLHEQACAIAAEAYGQYTNRLGVALVTTGPGGTNAITGVAGAWLDSTPVLFLSGQVKRADMIGNRGVRQMGFQEVDIVSLVRPITKYAATIMEPETIRYHLEKAVYEAKHGRPGPVWIDIPLDVQAAMIDETDLEGFEPCETEKVLKNETLQSQVRKTIDLLNTAKRPVILAGNGIRLSNAIEDFLLLGKALNIPILTTWKAMDFLPEDHPLYVGRPGAIGQRGANFTQQNADFLLIIGARLDFGQTAYNHENFAPGSHKIMVDIDSAEINKMRMKIDVRVCCNAADYIREFSSQLSQVRQYNRSDWIRRCKEWQAKFPVILPEYWNETNFVNDYVLIDVLSEEMTGSDLMIPGSSGACSERTMQAFRVKQGQRVFNTEGLGSMGFGIPSAIGGCLASGRKRTVCIDGDGGFMMNIQDLETVKRLSLPIKFFVLNNGGYVSIQTTQNNYCGGQHVGSSKSSGLTLPDIIAVSKAFGIPCLKMMNHQKIREQVREILENEGPFVCEVMVSAEQVTAPRISSRQREDGSMESMPMEDLWPFLDRTEFKANMLISQPIA